MDREINYDSNLERKFFLMLESNSQVKYYFPQPFQIDYDVKFNYNGLSHNNRWNYYPDILVVLQDNSQILIEIKNYFDLTSLRSRIKLELLKTISKNNGYGYLISTNGKYSLDEAISYPIDQHFEKEIIKIITKRGNLPYEDYLKIKNRYILENYWILPLAYRNNIYMEDKELAILDTDSIKINKLKLQY
ncbi:TnsA endonuclease-like protein [Orenia metallireducens]|uniref:TnsA endonuclease N terminal n=1 Tax=Orenia metallireducens TaxID=1413210 RepID=A0A285I467_9FIRM|nr:TnsA endonuclease N-terminal domain-containing protein [Orenia metallireducens]PRX23161.1 TnsA endonuclease-like protein [Orenia metallireducens]SNY42758.1 TnsA endonuclease N terminal [Orenia metallireducens]